GLKSGDIIKEINRKPIKSIEDYQDSIKNASVQKGILFFVTRNDSPLYVVVKEK
ncbi:MAG: protease Do, partial [Deltaproteobacteria bacterium]|nr:protease Do [Deltaproteobacteria bacterium]